MNDVGLLFKKVAEAKTLRQSDFEYIVPPKEEWIWFRTICTTPWCGNKDLPIDVLIPHKYQQIVCGVCDAQLNRAYYGYYNHQEQSKIGRANQL